MTGPSRMGDEPGGADAGVEPSGTEDEGLQAEVSELRHRLAAAEARSAAQTRTRLGIVARVMRAAVRDPVRRRTLGRDVMRAVVDRTDPAAPAFRCGCSYPLPSYDLPRGPVARPDLRVAVVLDQFSELSFRYEWDQVTFGPGDWWATLKPAPPDLLFVESAWRGNGGSWSLHMTQASGPSAELRELVGWCRSAGIPTVFWNKEDPPNYGRFLSAARLFDHVFTVDADRIPAYRRDLGHDRVDLLPFAAQPRIHNPIRRGSGRVYDVAFAGSYFADKHPERRAQMDYVLGPALDFGLHIYSRLQTDDRRYRFPTRYRANIVGTLRYEDMLAAYTSYKAFLNVNSVTTSRTMCARRLLELSAAQTPVVSAPAASIQGFFGDEIEVVRDADETRRALSTFLHHAEYRDRRALRAHRRVFDQHLYTHRVDTVLEAAGLASAHRSRQEISVIVPTNRPGQLDHVLEFVGRQAHRHVQLVLVQHGFAEPENELAARARVHGVDHLTALSVDVSVTLGRCMNMGLAVADGEFIAKMDDDNFYGDHYLTDLVRAFDYTEADVVGKWAHLVHLEGSGATLLRFPDAEHRYVDLVQGGTILARRAAAVNVGFDDLPRRVDTTFLDKIRATGGKVYSADRFNFVSVRRADPDSHTWTITEKELLARQSRLLFYGEPYAHAQV